MTDDNADDDGYKALRSVWLSMPDEDPPDRGLSELMAAARVKADEMTKPTVWQRIAATLRRPPVLALATLMVVLGGAALIGRHRDTIEVSKTADQTIIAGSGSPSASAPHAEPEAPAPEPMQAAAPAQAMEAAKKDEPAGKAATATPPPPPEQPKHHASATRSVTTAAPHGGAAAGPTMADKNSVLMAPQELATDDAAEATPSGPQLHKSAREAAARGDCETVTRLKRKIESIDAHYYQTNVANDSKLAVCNKKN